MPRSVNSVAAKARRKKVLKEAKGYFGRRKNVHTVAKNAVEKAMLYAYIGRKQKKRNFRALWIQRINAGAREHGMSYSVFMGKISAKGITLNRKVLADLALNHPEAFKSLVDNPEFVEVNETSGSSVIILEISVGSSDIGKVIGKEGRIANAIRTIVKAAAAKSDKKVTVEILTNDD